MNKRFQLAFLLVILWCGQSVACTCFGAKAKSMREVAEWYATRPEISLVFEGKVVKQEVLSGSLGGPATAMSMTLSGRHRVVEFDVTHVFRGTSQTHLTVVTGMANGDCGYDFWPGESYLVYATSGEGVWFTSTCAGTRAIEDSGYAVRYFSGEKPTAEDLLSPEEYQKYFYDNVLTKRTGSVCGQVLKPDGSPLDRASVDLWQPRKDDLPPRRWSEQNLSSTAGHFCIKNVHPGKYFLTAEKNDFQGWSRFMAFYPGVNSQADATQLSIEARVSQPDVKFTTIHEAVYEIRIRVLASDKVRLSYKNGCGVAVDSVERNPLSYHINHTLEEDGSYTFGFIPPGKYLVTTYFQPNFVEDQMKPFPEAAMWKAAQKEVAVTGNTEVVVQMEPTDTN
jgi:hypothetical protein